MQNKRANTTNRPGQTIFNLDLKVLKDIQSIPNIVCNTISEFLLERQQGSQPAIQRQSNKYYKSRN